MVPGDEHIERRIRAFIRWNAAMMVVKATRTPTASAPPVDVRRSASLYEIGFNHFFRGPDDGPGDQSPSKAMRPGVYARAFLEDA